MLEGCKEGEKEGDQARSVKTGLQDKHIIEHHVDKLRRNNLVNECLHFLFATPSFILLLQTLTHLVISLDLSVRLRSPRSFRSVDDSSSLSELQVSFNDGVVDGFGGEGLPNL